MTLLSATLSTCGRPRAGLSSTSPLWPMLADYNMEIREQTPRGDGIRHVDTPATIAKLREAHITTYFYLVFHAASD